MYNFRVPMEERYRIEYVSEVLRTYKLLSIEKRLEHGELAIKQLAYDNYIPLCKQPWPQPGDLTRQMLQNRKQGLRFQRQSVKYKYKPLPLPA